MKNIIRRLFFTGLLLISGVSFPETADTNSADLTRKDIKALLGFFAVAGIGTNLLYRKATRDAQKQRIKSIRELPVKKKWQHYAIAACGGIRQQYGDWYTCDLAQKYADYRPTQSVSHFKKNGIQFDFNSSEFFIMQDFIKKGLRKERVLSTAGYITFYHAQQSKKFVPIKLDTLLYSIRTGCNTDNFLLLHTKPDPVMQAVRTMKEGDSEELVRAAVLEQESKRREQLLSGPRQIGRGYSEDRSFYLFLNDSLAGNETEGADPGCSSWKYFKSNSNARFPGAGRDVQSIFNNHGYGHLAAEFTVELEQLQREYLGLSKYGTLYLIGVPKETVHLNVVAAKAFGYIQPLTVGWYKTTDMQKIAPALLTDSYVEPTDTKEYVAIMTHDEHGWLNPACGVKMFPMIIATSEEKKTEFENKWKSFETRLRMRITELKN